MTAQDQLQALANTITAQQWDHLIAAHLDCEANLQGSVAVVRPGRKYAKIDIGSSGRYMVEMTTGRIYGIKSYGVIHRGHYFGTLDTISDWNWGGYHAGKMAVSA